MPLSPLQPLLADNLDNHPQPTATGHAHGESAGLPPSRRSLFFTVHWALCDELAAACRLPACSVRAGWLGPPRVVVVVVVTGVWAARQCQ